MNNLNVVISYFVAENERYIYKELLEDKADIIFLKDIKKDDRLIVLEKADILITWNVFKELYITEKTFSKNLKFVQLLSAGYDHLNFSMFPESCIIAANQGAYAPQMAEHTIAMILALSKRLLLNHKKLLHGEFDQVTLSRTLRNSTAGIIGYGSIGKATAELLKSFNVKILAINTSGRTSDNVEFIGTLDDLDYVLSKSDIVILSIPLNNLTRGLIGKRELELMKPDAILINIARGGLIKEKYLFDHLKTNPDFLAGIDAWWAEPSTGEEFKLNYPVLELPNVIGSPHNSAFIPGALIEGQKRVVENVKNFIENKPLRGIVKLD